MLPCVRFWRFPQSKKQPLGKTAAAKWSVNSIKRALLQKHCASSPPKKRHRSPGASRHRGEHMSGYIWMLLWLLIYTALLPCWKYSKAKLSAVCRQCGSRSSGQRSAYCRCSSSVRCAVISAIPITTCTRFPKCRAHSAHCPITSSLYRRITAFSCFPYSSSFCAAGRCAFGFAFSPRFSSGRSLKTIGFIRKAIASVCFCSSLPRIISPG